MLNDKIIMENVTSFSVNSTQDYALATTFSNRLFVINLEDNSCIGTEGRVIERGALLIGHEPGIKGIRTWLQMNRGNLEQICPRDLLVERVKVLIDRREYKDALKEMRRHRLNMNLIYDHG
jgi:elongator complex protein 1